LYWKLDEREAPHEERDALLDDAHLPYHHHHHLCDHHAVNVKKENKRNHEGEDHRP
jgi:hypothetical protein